MQHVTMTRESEALVSQHDGTFKHPFPMVTEGHIGEQYDIFDNKGNYKFTLFDIWSNHRKPVLIARSLKENEFTRVATTEGGN